jgi:hypothetical protein
MQENVEHSLDTNYDYLQMLAFYSLNASVNGPILTHVSLERISQRSHSHWGSTTKRTMTKVQCSGCHSWFANNGYLYRHMNNTPQCLGLAEQIQEVELE